jgi:hypothetical protein
MTTDHPPGVEIPPQLFNAVKIRALRAALAALEEDDTARQVGTASEIAGIIAAGPQLAAAVMGYPLGNFVNELGRGYGSTAAAVDEIGRELSRAVIGAVDHG